MLKNRIRLGIILSIFLLVFSINGFTSYYKYTQESGTNFYVGAPDKADALEDTNEVRQIIDDLGALLVHSKRNDLYPKDETTGGTIQIPEAGLKFSNAPVNDDIAAYIAGEMTWQTKIELSLLTDIANVIDSLHYTDTSIDHEHLAPDIISGMPDVTSADEDYILIWDATDSLLKKCDMGEVRGAGAGYTNLTEFVDQTAWRLFYSNNLGDVTELALGTDGQYLKSTGATSAPIFDTPGGAGDMLKATYDNDEDGDIDVAAGGTEKSAWTQYAIPYLSNTTVFGEIPIGTDNYALTVNGATGYDWTHLQVYDAGLLSLAGLTYTSDSFIKVTATDTYAIRTIAEVKTDLAYQLSDMSDVGSTTPTDTYVLVADGDSWESRALVEADISDLGTYLENVVEDTTPELGGEMDAGAHSIGFTLQQFTAVDATTTIDWKLGNKFEFTFDDENQTFTFTPPTNAQNMMLWLIQDGTGSRTITWPVTCRWPGGVEGVLSTAGGSVDVVGIAWNGTNYDCVINNAFAVP